VSLLRFIAASLSSQRNLDAGMHYSLHHKCHSGGFCEVLLESLDLALVYFITDNDRETEFA
jgi:hypothetical protein